MKLILRINLYQFNENYCFKNASRETAAKKKNFVFCQLEVNKYVNGNKQENLIDWNSSISAKTSICLSKKHSSLLYIVR